MEHLNVSVSPHFFGKRTTQNIMLDVIIALIPALIASVIIFGWRSLLITGVCTACCILSEYVFRKISKKDNTISDLSAVVTGLLLAFNLPVTIPIWQAIIGSVTAIIVVKQLFGGIGQNFANPAVTARIIMLIAFSGNMTNWTFPQNSVDALSGATPLAAASQGLSSNVNYMTLFLGNHGGCLGETCALAIILGGIYLLIRKVITWHIPVAFISTVAAMSFLCGKDTLYQILSGGLLLAAFFMATDYSTSPSTPWGKIIFGIGCGLITILIRFWGSLPEGISYSILLMNILTPYISKLTRQKPLGAAGGAK